MSAPPTTTSATTPVSLSIVIAAYQEAESLALMLPAIKTAARALTTSCEVLVVDTMQPMDDTAAVCAANGVRHIPRRGGNSYGDAVRTIIADARGEFLLNIDADGSHNPQHFARLWAERERYDVVIGSRYAPGGRSDNPTTLVLMSRLVNTIFRFVFRMHVRDVSNSFRLYRRSVLTPLHLQSENFDILEEILIKLALSRPPVTIGEVPITFQQRKAGASKRKLLSFALASLKTWKRLRTYAAAEKAQR